MSSSTNASPWCFNTAATTNVTSAMWPTTSTSTVNMSSANSEFSALQDTQGISGAANAVGNSGWPMVSENAPNGGSAQSGAVSDLHAAQRPANLGSLGGFGNVSAANSGAQGGTPNGSQQTAGSNLWSSSFMPQTTGVATSGWNAPADSQADINTAWNQQRSSIRSSWTDAVGNTKSSSGGQSSPTGAQSDPNFGAGSQQQVVPDAGLGALTVQTAQSGSANGGPPTNASNGDQFGATSGGASGLIKKYPRVSFDELEEPLQRLINAHDGWGRVPVDQKTTWNIEAIMEQRNRLAEQLEQREAEQRANVNAAGAVNTESNIWTNEPNTGTNIWEQSRESTNAPGSSAPYWNANSNANSNPSSNANRPNAQLGNEGWRGGRSNDLGTTWDDRNVPQNAETAGLHRSSSSSSGGAAGGNGTSRGLQHWNSTDPAAQRPAAPPQRGPAGSGFGFTGASTNASGSGPNAGGAQADFSSQNFGQPGSIGVWGEEDGGTGAAQWGATNDSQNGPNRSSQWNVNGQQRSNASGPNWQPSGNQPNTPMAGQFAQQAPFGAGSGNRQQRKPVAGWTERGVGGNAGEKNVDDGTNLWGTQRPAAAAQGNTGQDWGTSTETGVWDAGTPTGLGPKRSGSDAPEWDADQSNASGRIWGGQDVLHNDAQYGEWPGASSGDQSSGDAAWNRQGKPIRSQFAAAGQPGGSFAAGSGNMQQAGAAGFQQNVTGGTNYDQSSMGSGGGYQRAKLLSRLTAQGFSREEAQAALIRNNMDYDRTLSELNRQRIQSGMPVGLPPVPNPAGVPIRGQFGGGAMQHDSGMSGHFGQFDASASGDQNAMLIADLMQKQATGGAGANSFLNPALLSQQQMAALSALQSSNAGANNSLAVQQKMLAGGTQANNARGPNQIITGGNQQQPQAPRNAPQNSSLALANLTQNAQQPSSQVTAPQLQALSQLPPAQMAIVQQYVKLNAQIQQLMQQRAAAPNMTVKNEINLVIEKLQAQLKIYEQQLMQLQAQQRFPTPASGGVPQAQGGMQKQNAGAQSSSRLNQWITSDAQGGDALAGSASSFAGIADSIPEFVPGKPWPGAQFSRDLETDPNATPASVAQQRLALATRQQLTGVGAGMGNMQSQAAAPVQQSATTYLLLRNVTPATDMGVLRQVANQFGKVTNFVPVSQLAICVIAYASRADAEKARNGFMPLATRGIAMELLSDPELARVLQQAATGAGVAQPQQSAAGGARTGTPTGSSDSSLLPNGLLNS